MARRCDICGKGPMSGNNVSHSHRKTRRRWKPNLHKVKRVVNGKKVTLYVCTKCLKKIDELLPVS
ncbi:MAG TPA: 50S ribosomal protein L28 [Firmicutes bacterium]|nr:50S ribosomal protein L28 [Bacillota bacterium]